MWVWLLIACGGDAARIETLEAELAEARESVATLQSELAQRRKRQASIERLDAAMEAAHTVVLARCTGPVVQTDILESYRLDSVGTEEALGDLEAVMRQGRWIPHGSVEDPAGWRLVRTPRGGLFASCGLRPADVLVAINGVDVKGSEGLAQAKADVIQKKKATFSLLRNRKPLTVEVVAQ